MHVDVSHEEEGTIEALDDVMDNEACLASDVLDILNNEDIDDNQPSSNRSDYQVGSHTQPSTSIPVPMIERNLWVSESNPVRINATRR